MNSESPSSDSRTLIPVGVSGVELRDVDSMFRFATLYIQSGLAPKSFQNAQQLVICWCKAAELGLSALQATDGMSVINGRVGIMGDLGLAMVESKGLLVDKNVEYTGEGNDLTCTLTIQRKGKDAKVYSFSVADAKQAQIYDRSPIWKAYPKRMTYYRALGFALRDEFSDVMKGTKTTEELADYPDSNYVQAQEDKIAENQRREPEARARLAKDPKVKIVEAQTVQPTPKAAAEPAFEEDKKKPAPAARKEPPAPVVAAPPAFAEKLQEDFPPEEKSMLSPEPDEIPDIAPESAGPPWWEGHVIGGVKSFKGRTVGSLNPNEMGLIEAKWIPAYYAQQQNATPEQVEDLKAFEARIAHSKTAKAW